MNRTMTTIVGALIIGTGCTPAQLDRWESTTGLTFGTETRAVLLDVDNRPMVLPDGRTIDADGTLSAPGRARACDEFLPTLIDVGWSPEAARWASGVMWRETRCNTAAVSRTGDYGLLQINTIVLADMRQRPALWADTIARLGGVPSRADLLDPTVNAIVALGLFHIRGTRPWT